MTVKSNWNGLFVEDADERRAYVSKEDALELATSYKLDQIYKKAAITAIIFGWILGIFTILGILVIFK